MADIEVIGARELIAALHEAGLRAATVADAVVVNNGELLAQRWRDRARVTAGRHGRRYPASITTERLISGRVVSVDIGPEVGRPQGGMGRGFEYGSVNQPPHLDGKQATDETEPQFVSELEAAAGGLL